MPRDNNIIHSNIIIGKATLNTNRFVYFSLSTAQFDDRMSRTFHHGEGHKLTQVETW